jgi:hypothetical protein
VVLQNEVLGQLKVPRNKISTIALGSAANASRPSASTNKLAQARTAAGGVADAETAGALSELGAHTNLIQQIQKQFLGDAGPQANDKFNDLLNGLLTGKMDISGLRAEAKSAADQIRAMKKDSGGEANDMLDAYLGVLENFLADSSK